MNAMRDNTAHMMAPEEVMAYLDGELTAEEAEAVAAHLRDCAECATGAEELRGVSRAMDAWTVEAAPASLERNVREAARSNRAGRADVRRGWFQARRAWLWGGAVAFLVIAGMVGRMSYRQSRLMNFYDARPAPAVERAEAYDNAAQSAGGARTDVGILADDPGPAGAANTRRPNFASLQQIAPGLAAPAPPPPLMGKADRFRGGVENLGIGPLAPNEAKRSDIPQGPMIARTVSLTLLVKNVADARGSLDALVAREQGYAAQLTFSTPEAGARSLQASLRVPAGELATALDGLRKLGRVEEETQSGEEVTQQHADLVARLTNSREEEQRLRALLAQRTGKIEDVLQVEEEIARVRGEIESKEAEQKGLEHRVDFANVDLKLVEEYKAQLGTPAEGVGTRVHNSFVTGVQNAGGSLLGMLLFLEEVGPILLIWGAIIGLPGWLVWRRFRKAQTKLG